MKLQQANKVNRQKQVVKTAARLFSSTGYRLTTVEMVAQRANVSPVTIYNNFESKTGLLLAVLIDEGADMEEVGGRIVAQRTPADLSVIYNLVDVYVGHPMEFMNKACWRESLAAAITSSNKRFMTEYQNVDKRLARQLKNVVCRLHEEHVFEAGVDADILGTIIWNNVNQMFTDFISDETMTLQTLKESLHRQISELLNLAGRTPAAT